METLVAGALHLPFEYTRCNIESVRTHTNLHDPAGDMIRVDDGRCHVRSRFRRRGRGSGGGGGGGGGEVRVTTVIRGANLMRGGAPTPETISRQRERVEVADCERACRRWE